MSEMLFGGQSMVGDLKRVLIRSPDKSFGEADPALWNYTTQPNMEKATKEHEGLADILKKEGVEVIYHSTPLPRHADAIFVQDPVVMTNYGAMILRMGKPLRNGEEAAIKQTLKDLGIPIFFEMSGNATAEGGDTLWLDESTFLIGRGFRTNQEGIDQIRQALTPKGVNVIQFDLPYDQGKKACLHLQSLISMVDKKKAVVYLKYFPVAFLELLEKNNFELIEVGDDEYSSLGSNILAIRPNVCLAIQGNDKIIGQLKKAGCHVLTYQGNEISLKAEGGPTCLTRPILRK